MLQHVSARTVQPEPNSQFAFSNKCFFLFSQGFSLRFSTISTLLPLFPPHSFHPKMAHPNVEERTVKRVDVDHKFEINLPANAPSGNPHIILWDAVKRDNIPHDLSTVDVIVTVIFELNPSALA
ncbi:dd517b87-f79c-4b83-a075-b66e040a33b4-CDS [Sclerotinia trifoliorum]|uniref:Dd517b87-f79c-4b83-a075-b66e040a33b4-CDS n=1 Tax=Sclerotinia trifoliorum TaxID=28548 RepID=A0A8H2VS99_9HELO|nr:dd517b87-f79c-4b83-a075-b66e040a33b4-CDS [Sclerotinia trifoliorum]